MAANNVACSEKGFRFKGSHRRVWGFIFVGIGVLSFIGNPSVGAVVVGIFGAALVSWGYYIRSKKIVVENFFHKAAREAAEKKTAQPKNTSRRKIKTEKRDTQSRPQPISKIETVQPVKSAPKLKEDSREPNDHETAGAISVSSSDQVSQVTDFIQANTAIHNELPVGKKLLWDRNLVVDDDSGRQTVFVMKKHEKAGRKLAKKYLGYDWVEMYGRLMPERSNPYDPNAVKVCVNASVVGYLSYGAQNVAKRDLARDKKKCFIKLLFKAYSLDDYKYWFFASPGDMEEWKSYLANGNTIGVKANLRHSKEYQNALQELNNKDSDCAGTVCTIKVDKQPSGKYKNGPRLTIVDPNDTVLGVIDARYQTKDSRFFAAVLSGHTQCVVKVFESFMTEEEEGNPSLYGVAYLPGVH